MGRIAQCVYSGHLIRPVTVRVSDSPIVPGVSGLKLDTLDMWQHMILSEMCPVLSGKCPVLSGTCPVILSDHVRKECPECPVMSGDVR